MLRGFRNDLVDAVNFRLIVLDVDRLTGGLQSKRSAVEIHSHVDDAGIKQLHHIIALGPPLTNLLFDLVETVERTVDVQGGRAYPWGPRRRSAPPPTGPVCRPGRFAAYVPQETCCNPRIPPSLWVSASLADAPWNLSTG